MRTSHRYCGQGYGYEAADACLSHARTVLRLPRLVAITSPQNAASIHLLEKLGFGFERFAVVAKGQPEVKVFGRSLR